MSALLQIVRVCGVDRLRLAVATGLGAIAAGFGVALLATAGYLISRAAEQPPVLSLMTVVVAVRFFGLARPIARYLERLATHDLALRALGRIRAHVYAHLEPLAPAGIESYRRGDLLTRMIADVDSLQGLYPRLLEPALVTGIVGACCVAAAFWLSPPAGVALLAGLVMTAVMVPAAAAALSRRRARLLATARAELHAELMEVEAGVAETIVFGRESQAFARVAAADDALATLARREGRDAGVVAGATVLIAGVTVAAVLAEAVQASHLGALARVDVAALVFLSIGALELTVGISGIGRELTSTAASARRVLDLCTRVPLVRDPDPALAPPPPAPVVTLERVDARYDSSSPLVLELPDLRLEPGCRTAITGPSGVGKTTIVNLLLRFLDPESGSVAVADGKARNYRQEDLRRTFAVAGQDAHLFDSTIRQNLLLARPSAEPDELQRALRLARIDRWVASLPDGVDTLVGEDGRKLSGGERQRLVIARALLADAPVLILDEPTAHLDHATAQALMDDVLSAAGDRAVLLITHRTEGLQAMDEIITMPATRG